MTKEQREALKALRDAGGAAPAEALDQDVIIGLLRMGLISHDKDLLVRITEKGRKALDE